jgi:hypothetical protein
MYKSRLLILGILIGCLYASVSFAATGPVPASSLPGGATVVDSDPVVGEAWGRVGGRTYTYSGFVLANFTLLEWQSISAGMSFDGPVDDVGEDMSGPSLGLTALEYTGTTTVSLPGGPTAVNTRFTVNLVGATFMPGTTKVDVLANPAFSVNVLFEAEVPGFAGWGPALDVFDALDTPAPPPEMLANTSFEQGFFFDEVEGLSVAEHDANMQARADEIVGMLTHLTLEELGHFNSLVAQHADLSNKLDQLLGAGGNEDQLLQIQAAIAENNQKLMEILGAIFGLPDLGDQLNSVQNDLTGLIACLWIGFLCPDEVPEGVPNLALMSADLAEILVGIDWAKEDIEALQEALAALSDELASKPSAIELEVISSNAASGSSQVFLVLSKVHGVPTTAALSVTAAPESGPGGFSLVPVSSASLELAPGVQQVTVDVQGSLNSTHTFLIIAERALPDDVYQYGSTLTSTQDRED